MHVHLGLELACGRLREHHDAQAVHLLLFAPDPSGAPGLGLAPELRELLADAGPHLRGGRRRERLLDKGGSDWGLLAVRRSLQLRDILLISCWQSLLPHRGTNSGLLLLLSRVGLPSEDIEEILICCRGRLLLQLQQACSLYCVRGLRVGNLPYGLQGRHDSTLDSRIRARLRQRASRTLAADVPEGVHEAIAVREAAPAVRVTALELSSSSLQLCEHGRHDRLLGPQRRQGLALALEQGPSEPAVGLQPLLHRPLVVGQARRCSLLRFLCLLPSLQQFLRLVHGALQQCSVCLQLQSRALGLVDSGLVLLQVALQDPQAGVRGLPLTLECLEVRVAPMLP
mmetsp:Transcript_107558/g.304153  ORF Transcript_107558/g.304153 Transcript_107558/m.304153 type:complete len:341 (-) Transcript_107558:248-1270(-)